jgi:hypothetical protein
MRLFCFASILLISVLACGQDHSQTKDSKNKTAQTNADSASNPSSQQNGTPHGSAESHDEHSDSQQKSKHWLTHGEWVMSVLTFIYVALTGVYVVISAKTLNTIKDDVESSARQFSDQLKVAQDAAQAANDGARAMVKIAQTIEIGNKAITRAYLTVIVNAAIFQERGIAGQEDRRFQGIPKLLNTGVTTARKIRIRINADVLPMPIAKDFSFPARIVPETSEAPQFLSLGAHQNADLMGGVVDGFAPDQDVAEIKEGVRKALCVWGTIDYEDIFGDPHSTKFGQQLYWWSNGTVRGLFIPGQNDAD